jgi:UDP-N-acetylglucosamine 4,6-dehydratase/5-epimerase
MFKNKTIMVTGGTGSFGNTFIKRILEEDKFGKIIVFSRDEKKQHDMMTDYRDSRLEFVIGDVRDRDKVISSMCAVDFVFHAAALKHVPSCEFFPMEAIKTNILGSGNILDAAEINNVKKVVVLSTDKAVYPINSMGFTKGLMEKLMQAKAKTTKSDSIFCAVRYGNVMYSRGSVLPLFVKQIRAGKKLTITHPQMTRFLLPLPFSVDLVLFALEKANPGDIFVKKAPAATIEDTANACLNIFNTKNDIEIIGTRDGEKMHETLITKEELHKSEEFSEYFRISSDTEMNYDKFFTHGYAERFNKDGYTSENTKRLTIEELEELLLSLDEVKKEVQNLTYMNN